MVSFLVACMNQNHHGFVLTYRAGVCHCHFGHFLKFTVPLYAQIEIFEPFESKIRALNRVENALLEEKNIITLSYLLRLTVTLTLYLSLK